MPPPGASIAVRRSGEDVVIEIDHKHVGDAGNPMHLADRVAAAGGGFTTPAAAAASD